MCSICCRPKWKSFLFKVGTALGSLVILTCPALSEVSRHVVCDSFSLNLLRSSPDKKWILAASEENFDLSPKVGQMLPKLISVHFIVAIEVKQCTAVGSSRNKTIWTFQGKIIMWCILLQKLKVCVVSDSLVRNYLQSPTDCDWDILNMNMCVEYFVIYI